MTDYSRRRKADDKTYFMITTTSAMKAKKEPTVEYGIVITRPWSKEMYDHNDKVSATMKENILMAATDRFKNYNEEDLIFEDEDLYILAKAVCAYGFVDFSAREVFNELVSELVVVPNFWLYQEYPYLVKAGYVPALEQGLVGYSK